MKLADLLATVEPAYGETWDGARTYMMEDPHERRRVEELEKEHLERGLDDPITLYEDDDEDPNPGSLSVSNGMHRVIAAWNLGLDEVPVRFTLPEDPEKDLGYYKTTDFTFSIFQKHYDALPSPEAKEEMGEKIFDCLTSSGNFRLNHDTWVETMLPSSNGRGRYTEYTISLYPLDEKLHVDLANRMMEQISCCVPKSWIEWPEIANRTAFDEDYFA